MEVGCRLSVLRHTPSCECSNGSRVEVMAVSISHFLFVDRRFCVDNKLSGSGKFLHIHGQGSGNGIGEERGALATRRRQSQLNPQDGAEL